jgi:hypothetical protein
MHSEIEYAAAKIEKNEKANEDRLATQQGPFRALHLQLSISSKNYGNSIILKGLVVILYRATTLRLQTQVQVVAK